MSEFPSGWIQKPLKSLVSLNEKLRDIEDDEDCGFVPMNLVPTKLMGKIQHEQKKWGDCKKGYTHFKDGDVLLAKITPCFENGKSVLVSGLPNGIGAGSTEYFVLRSELLDSRYLHAFAKTKQFKDDCTVRMTGSVGHKRVPKDYLLEYPIPVAPLNEQIRIADKLDSVLAKVDAAQARLEKIPTLLKRFRQSVLAAATSGELTREWRIANSEINAVAELQRLEKIKASLIGEKLVKKDLFFSVSEELETPSNWGEVKLGSLSSKITDGEHSTPKRESEGYYLLSARNVRDGAVSLEKVDYVGEEEFIKLRKRCDPNKGDILISCSGSVGRVALCDRSDAYVMVRSAALVKTDHMNQNNRFLMYVLQSPVLQEIIVEKSKATAQANLFLEPIKELPIPYPPKEEQKEIVRRVESLFTLADTVEKQYLAAKQRLDRLTQSLLAKAFRGELVPQDPNDEPAAELLKRIQAERNAQPPVKNKRAKSA